MENQKGFTLPEVLVVLLILTLLFTLTVPSLQHNWQMVTMDCAILQLHRDIRWAQRYAQQEQKTVTVVFYRDKQPYRYVISCAGKGNLRRRTLPDDLQGFRAQTITIYANRTIRTNGHIFLQKGDVQRYVYYYQTGRTRVTKAAAA